MTKFLLQQKYIFIAICAVLTLLSSVIFIVGENHFGFDSNDLKAFVLSDEQVDKEHNEDFYRKLIKNEKDEFMILETDVTIKYVTSKWREKSGYEEDCLIKKNFFSFVHASDLPFIANSMLMALDTKAVKDGIGPFRIKDSKDQYSLYMAESVPVFDKHGDVVLLALILRDLSNPLGGNDEEKDLSTVDREELENLISMAN